VNVTQMAESVRMSDCHCQHNLLTSCPNFDFSQLFLFFIASIVFLEIELDSLVLQAHAAVGKYASSKGAAIQ
jgi:hypothetical protein